MMKLENKFKEEKDKLNKENAELTEKYQSLLAENEQLKKDMMVSAGDLQKLRNELFLCKKRNRDNDN